MALYLCLAAAALAFGPADKPAPKCGPKVSRPITPTKTAAFDNAFARGPTVPSVVLCRPFDAGNVGAAARAMLNFGLWDLRVVQPTDPEVTISEEAILRASGAAPILHTSTTHSSLPQAVEDLQLVLATTARPRESRIPVRTREAVERAVAAIQRGERVGLLFGSEKNGLSNEELEATEIVTIPTCEVLLAELHRRCSSCTTNGHRRSTLQLLIPTQPPRPRRRKSCVAHQGSSTPCSSFGGVPVGIEFSAAAAASIRPTAASRALSKKRRVPPRQ